MGQKKLNFTSPATAKKCEKDEKEEAFVPIFGASQLRARTVADQRALELEPGRVGSTRQLAQFPENHPKLLDFRQYLQSVDGHSKSEKSAREISTDVSKILYYINHQELRWNSLLDSRKLLSYFEMLKELSIKASGRCTKMERCGDSLRYMKFMLRDTQQKAAGTDDQKYARTFDEMRSVEERLAAWKTSLRKEKKRADTHRLERESNELPPLDTLNEFLESAKMRETFEAVIQKAEKGKEVSMEELRFAMGAVCIPAMMESSKRPSVMINCTQAEFERGRMTNGVYVVNVAEHKTTHTGGPAKLMFEDQVYRRALKYRDLIRPLCTVEKGDIPNFFVVPGSKPIDKVSNVTRVLEKKLEVTIPSATTVRKMGSTAVARTCSEKTMNIVARHMNHDPSTSRKHYQATVSDSDAARVYNTIRKLRLSDTPDVHGKDNATEESADDSITGTTTTTGVSRYLI